MVAHTGVLEGLLRRRDDRGGRVTFFELFFDLVYVFAVTQLSHLLLEHLTVRGAFQTLMLWLAVWWAWMYTTWATNWLDPNQTAVRLMLVGVMLLSLLMSSALPEAFGDRGLLFAGAYAAIQIGRTAFVMLALRHDPQLHRNFQRILAWNVAASALWIGGAFAQESVREVIWLVALVVDYLAPASGFFVPGMGRSATTTWTIAGGHMAERCQLFVIIALGESILVSGSAFANLPLAPTLAVAFVTTFIGSVAMWWVYFARGGEEGGEVIAHATDPGRLGRSAYTYFHLPIIAGIIVTAVADELMIAHPTGHTDLPTLAVLLGGPALFLFGHALYKWAIFQRVSISRLVAIAVLAALIPVGGAVSPLSLGIATAGIIAGVAIWDGWLDRRAALSASH